MEGVVVTGGDGGLRTRDEGRRTGSSPEEETGPGRGSEESSTGPRSEGSDHGLCRRVCGSHYDECRGSPRGDGGPVSD